MTQIAKKEKADYLLTAHHGDDLLENILLKFIRSGNPEEMNSLQAVGVMHGVSLLRPLLAYSKQELFEYDRKMALSLSRIRLTTRMKPCAIDCATMLFRY